MTLISHPDGERSGGDAEDVDDNHRTSGAFSHRTRNGQVLSAQ
jgi:hypothetical protein